MKVYDDRGGKTAIQLTWQILNCTYTVKLVDAVTSIKKSPFSCLVEKFFWIESLLIGHLSYKTPFLYPKGDLLIQV
jgi:hypothetical protein